MSAFLKLDTCAECSREVSWEYVPPVTVAGRVLAGTGVWQSGLTQGRCAKCWEAFKSALARDARSRILRRQFVAAVGEVPYRDFTLDTFQVHAGNTFAFEHAKQFDPTRTNLYLWGSSGVGKTHLAVAILRRWFAFGVSLFLTCTQLVRRLRMREPDEEQRILDQCANAHLFVLDDLRTFHETSPFVRRVLTEVLDRRHYRGVGGLVVTSPHSVALYGRIAGDEATAARLRTSCIECELRGGERRDGRRTERSLQ
jgi:DNA replication protein DnaC